MNNSRLVIAIVGMGPRGISLLERLISNTIESKITDKIEFVLFDKNKDLGMGCHYHTLSKNLIVNTLASQITMYYGKEMQNTPTFEGMNFYEWYRNNVSNDVKETDYLSRADLGRYLNYFFLEQEQRMKDNGITFNIVYKEVKGIEENSEFIEVKTDEKSYRVSKAILCLGHQENKELRDNKTYIGDILHTASIRNLSDVESVAVQGMGLTSFDVISELTEGRDGKFDRDENGELYYIPSGKEPMIYLYSRTGIPLSGRASNNDPEYIYKPKFFTIAAIDHIRSDKKQLDFEEDVLPLLIKELEYAYETRSNGKKLDIDSFLNFENKLNKSSQEEFVESLISHLEFDIEHSALGRYDSPYKFCQDIIRDIRDVLRYAVDFKGLIPQSHKDFITKWQPKFVRICIGPPAIRIEQMKALIDAKICNVGFANNPTVTQKGDKYILKVSYDSEILETEVDFLISAIMPTLDFEKSTDSLICSLKEDYELFNRDNFFIGGFDINRDFQVIKKNGNPSDKLYGLGLAVEGSKYFTLVLGRPNMHSTFLYDSDKLAKTLLNNTF